MLEIRQGHDGERAILSGGFFGRHKVGTVFTQRIRGGIGCGAGSGRRSGSATRRTLFTGGSRGAAPASASSATGSGQAFLLRGNFGGQSGDNNDLSFYVLTAERVGVGLIDNVAIAGKNQVSGDLEGFERRTAAASSAGDCPVLSIFKRDGARTTSRGGSVGGRRVGGGGSARRPVHRDRRAPRLRPPDPSPWLWNRQQQSAL